MVGYPTLNTNGTADFALGAILMRNAYQKWIPALPVLILGYVLSLSSQFQFWLLRASWRKCQQSFKCSCSFHAEGKHSWFVSVSVNKVSRNNKPLPIRLSFHFRIVHIK